MILIIGQSSLAEALVSRLGSDQCVVVGRTDYDLSQQDQCDQLIADYPTPDIVINTLGAITTNYWHNMIVNLVAPSYITMTYAETLSKGHIINIGSASAWWPSWPELPFARLSYNISKQSLSEFNTHINRVQVDQGRDITISIVEPGRFQGKMSDFNGMPIEQVVDCVEYVIKSKVHQVSLVK